MRKPVLNSFGERLRYEMKRNMVSVAEIAESTGSSRSQISIQFHRSSCPKASARIFKARDTHPELDWDYIVKGYSSRDETNGECAYGNDNFYDAVSTVLQFMTEHGLNRISCLGLTITKDKE